MAVTALRIRLSMTVLMLLVSHVEPSYPETSDTAFHIIPTRLQLYEYEPVSFICEGFNVSAGWRVRTIKEFIPKCSNGKVTSTVICTIDFALESDSGGYWCEGGGGERSNTVNITVTGGPVILESPALPVMEGDAVTLSCRNKMTTSKLTADFYKDGLLVGSSSTGNMTIGNVSESHDGLYKCHFSGAGESPESRLTVRGKLNRGEGMLNIVFIELTYLMEKYNGSVKQSEDSNAQQADRRASHKDINFSRHYYILLWIVIAVILVLQLLVIGLLYWKKQLVYKQKNMFIYVSVLLEAKTKDPHTDMYTVVKKDKKKKEAADTADILSLCLDTNHRAKPQTAIESGVSSFTVTTAPSAAIDPPLIDEDCEYASIQEVGE
ncbi:hypothetical protein L3Q82_016493 [Scortum barcoo]|uniref:Uncharacterized protein n=1 Tax=Scortum barcoo TaxID=214431 RepID=A0ACB8X6M9_9TELE|nr:hypothetical protein L3Q82_016493 [Scortum barcoo]